MDISISSESFSSSISYDYFDIQNSNTDKVNINIENDIDYLKILDYITDSHLLIPSTQSSISLFSFNSDNFFYWIYYPSSLINNESKCDTINYNEISFYNDYNDSTFCQMEYGSCMGNDIGSFLNDQNKNFPNMDSLLGKHSNLNRYRIDSNENRLYMNFNDGFNIVHSNISLYGGKENQNYLKILEPKIEIIDPFVITHHITSADINFNIKNIGNIIGDVTISSECNETNGFIYFETLNFNIEPDETKEVENTFLFDSYANGTFSCIIRIMLPTPMFWSNENKYYEKEVIFDLFYGCTEFSDTDSFLGEDKDIWIKNDLKSPLGNPPFKISLSESWIRESRNILSRKIDFNIKVISNTNSSVQIYVYCDDHDINIIDNMNMITLFDPINNEKNLSYIIKGHSFPFKESFQCKMVFEILKEPCWSYIGKKVEYLFELDSPYDPCLSYIENNEPSIMFPLDYWKGSSPSNDDQIINIKKEHGWKKIKMNNDDIELYNSNFSFNLVNGGSSYGLFGFYVECNNSDVYFDKESSSSPLIIYPNEEYIMNISLLSYNKTDKDVLCKLFINIDDLGLYNYCWTQYGKEYNQVFIIHHDNGIFGIGKIGSIVLLSLIIILSVSLFIILAILLFNRLRKKNKSIWKGMNQSNIDILNNNFNGSSNDTRIYSDINASHSSNDIKQSSDRQVDSVNESNDELKKNVNQKGFRQTVIDDLSDDNNEQSTGNLYYAPFSNIHNNTSSYQNERIYSNSRSYSDHESLGFNQSSEEDIVSSISDS